MKLLEWIFAIVVVFGVIWIGFGTPPFSPLQVSGESMEPTLLDEQIVLVEHLSLTVKDPTYGDIVIAQADEQHDIVKRVVRLEDDHIEIRNGLLYRNGHIVHEPNYVRETMDQNFGPYTVPQGEVFLLGDNRNLSKDSRDPRVGSIPLERIEGKVVFSF